MPHNPTMPKYRTIPAVGVALLVPILAAWAQGPAPGPGASPPPPPQAPPELPPTPAEETLDAAIRKLADLKAIAADVVQQVDMLGETFTLKGQYLKASDYRMRLELKLEGLGDASGTMLQVCDGKTLWDYQQILDGRSYRRLDLGKILERMEGAELGDDLRRQIIKGIGFSGPEALLAGLRKAVRFEHQEEMTLGDRPVWVLRGQWKDMASLSGPGQPILPAGAAIPPYVPSVTILWIGRDDGWPYQVHLEGKIPSVLLDTRQIGQDGRRIGAMGTGQQVTPSRIELTYDNVQLDPELPPERFTMTVPPEAEVADDTEQFLLSLEQAAAVQAEARRAEAAKAGDPIQPIIVPKAPAEAPPPRLIDPTPAAEAPGNL